MCMQTQKVKDGMYVVIDKVKNGIKTFQAGKKMLDASLLGPIQRIESPNNGPKALGQPTLQKERDSDSFDLHSVSVKDV